MCSITDRVDIRRWVVISAAAATKLSQAPKAGAVVKAIAKVWLAGLTAWVLSHLGDIEMGLKILYWSLAIGFTIHQWRKSARKKAQE